MKRCKDCKWASHRWSIDCAIRDFWGKEHECVYYARKWWKPWAPKVLLITLALLLGGCSRVIVRLPDGTEVHSARFLDSTEIGHVSYDDGSFVMEGYKSDMSIALHIIDKLIAEREKEREKEKQFALKEVNP